MSIVGSWLTSGQGPPLRGTDYLTSIEVFLLVDNISKVVMLTMKRSRSGRVLYRGTAQVGNTPWTFYRPLMVFISHSTLAKTGFPRA